MKIGYARVSTKDQSVLMQVEALKEAGCTKIHEEIVSGAKTDRPVLDEIMRNLREGDTLVIWKLDRLGRNLAHLIQLTNTLMEKKVGLISLNDPIDTTTAQGRLVFGIFASLAEFERELIRERTQAGLKSARARGRKGGRPKGLTPEAIEKSTIAEALYKNGSIPVKKIAEQLGISKTTLYLYLRHRGVKIGTDEKSTEQKIIHPSHQNTSKVALIRLRLRIENNSKFVRGKKRAQEDIEQYCLNKYEPKQIESGEYVLKVPYISDDDLDKKMYDLLGDISSEADDRHCFSESDAHMEGTDRYW